MKRSRKVVALGLCLPLFLGLAACQQIIRALEATNQTQTSSDKVPLDGFIYQFKQSGKFQRGQISFYQLTLDPNSVEAFFNLVTDL